MEELGTRALTDLVELLEKGIEVVPPYLVDLFNRYAMFGIFKEGFLMFISLLTIILCLWGGLKILKNEEYAPASIMLIFPIVVGICGLIFCGMNLFEAIFIPEIYVIHDLQGCTSCG